MSFPQSGANDLKVILDKIKHCPVKVQRGVFSFVDSVRAVGINHHGKKLVVGNQLINQFFKALVMDVVVSSTMNDEQFPLELVSEGDG